MSSLLNIPFQEEDKHLVEKLLGKNRRDHFELNFKYFLRRRLLFAQFILLYGGGLTLIHAACFLLKVCYESKFEFGLIKSF